jgi:NAD(P)-dependent dehydrogenase (short-subunit alcohol dehydrogenase family)
MQTPPRRELTRAEQVGLAVAAGLGALVARRWARRRAYSFRHRSVVITGGSRGLGLEMARLLAREGASLALLARDERELARARESLAALGAEVVTIACDVGQEDAVERALDAVVDRYGRLDVLINNAGRIQVGPADHMRFDDFEDAMAVHFRGPLRAMLAAIPHMKRQHGGRIVNVASIGGKVPVPHLAPYVASKFALVGLSSSLRAELARHDIVVTTVSPGLMRTGSPINATVKGRHAAEFAWFAIGDALPGLSMDATRAARRILDACRAGTAEVVLTLPARLAVALYGLAPATVVQAATLVNRVLPGPTGSDGDLPRLGRDSGSRVAFSRLTRMSDEAAARNNELPRPTLA